MPQKKANLIGFHRWTNLTLIMCADDSYQVYQKGSDKKGRAKRRNGANLYSETYTVCEECLLLNLRWSMQILSDVLQKFQIRTKVCNIRCFWFIRAFVYFTQASCSVKHILQFKTYFESGFDLWFFFVAFWLVVFWPYSAHWPCLLYCFLHFFFLYLFELGLFLASSWIFLMVMLAK